MKEDRRELERNLRGNEVRPVVHIVLGLDSHDHGTYSAALYILQAHGSLLFSR